MAFYNPQRVVFNPDTGVIQNAGKVGGVLSKSYPAIISKPACFKPQLNPPTPQNKSITFFHETLYLF